MNNVKMQNLFFVFGPLRASATGSAFTDIVMTAAKTVVEGPWIITETEQRVITLFISIFPPSFDLCLL
jgi:hypothetical protein